MDPVYRDWYIPKNTSQVEEYGVKQASILQQKWDWKGTRLLMVEISVVNLRQEFGPSSWEISADILDNLDSAGFALAKIEKRFWKMEYWTLGT